jgi:hypothetical protein
MVAPAAGPTAQQTNGDGFVTPAEFEENLLPKCVPGSSSPGPSLSVLPPPAAPGSLAHILHLAPPRTPRLHLVSL